MDNLFYLALQEETANHGQGRPRSPKKPVTKTELLTNVAAAAGLSKKEVAAILEALAAEIKKSLSNKVRG